MRIGILCLAACAVSACGEPKEVSEANGSLTIYTASASEGLVGSYSDGNQTLNFETVRLPQDEVAEAAQPDRGRAYDIAVRISDENDTTMALLTEGSAFPDGWLTEPTPQDREQAAARDLDALRKAAASAATELGTLELSSDIASEKALLSQQLLSFSADRERHEIPGESQQAFTTGTTGRAQSAVAVTQWLQGIDSYWQWAFDGRTTAHHSATITYRYARTSGPWQFVTNFVMCNHGTCPYFGDMKYYATHWGPATYVWPATPQECPGAWGVTHLCNNDTLLQQDNVIYNQTFNVWRAPQCVNGLRYLRPRG